MTDTKAMPELLPCPFCGGEARSWYGPSNGGGVRCQNTSCQAFMRDFGSEELARAAWNRRADLAHQEALDVEALKREVYTAHIKSCGWTDEMIAEELAEDPDWEWGYNYGCKSAVDAAIDHLANRLNTPVPESREALFEGYKLEEMLASIPEHCAWQMTFQPFSKKYRFLIIDGMKELREFYGETPAEAIRAALKKAGE